MANKILFCTGEGVGNVIQTIPVIRTLNEVLGFEIDFWHAFGSFPIPKVIPYVDKWFNGGGVSHINPKDYVGKVSTFWTANHLHRDKVGQIKLLNDPSNARLSMSKSEVSSYMTIAEELGAKNFIWDGICVHNHCDDYFDIAIHNGYNWKGSSDWQLKSYPYYGEVIGLLEEYNFRICSVGNEREYIEGTIDRTGLPLLDTLGIVKNSGLFISNDSGLYHCANALQVTNIVIFTYTSTEKNYDPRFHKYATIVGRNDLDCRWCQCAPRFKTCTTRECRNIPPEKIITSIMELV